MARNTPLPEKLYRQLLQPEGGSHNNYFDRGSHLTEMFVRTPDTETTLVTGAA
jgi:hypothetical protein